MTTLYQIIKSELQLKGFNELENNGKFTFHDGEYSFMQKIAKYDEDIQEIVNNLIFKKFRLLDDEADKHFKKAFLIRFIDKSIKYETVETFSNQVVFTFMMNDEFINHVYDINNFLTNKNESSSNANNQSSNENRMARSELPQSEVNINVDTTTLDYANEFNLTKNKENSSNNSDTMNQQYNMDNLIKIKGLLESVFMDFEKNCFMQVF